MAFEDNVEISATSSSRKTSHPLFWTSIALISSFGVFALPFAFPPRYPSYSSSFTYGFSNRISSIAAIVISASVLLLLWWRRGGRPPAAFNLADRLPWSWFILASAAVTLFTASLGGWVVHSNVFFADAGYIQMQLDRSIHDHAVLYRDIEWPYGPALFYGPLFLVRVLANLGIGTGAAYMVALALIQIAGLGLLFYILGRLPLSRRRAGIVFALFTFGTLSPILGLNYTLFRFLLPQALFLAVTQFPSIATQAVLFAAGEFAALAVSPELGIAFLGAAGCYGLYRAFTSRLSWIVTAVTPLLGFAVFYAVMSKDYFDVMASFNSGQFTMLIQPEFSILVLLIAAIALSPIVVAPYLWNRDPRAGTMIGFYVISLAMLVPALGRCDPLHTFYGGLGVYLLSVLAVDRMPASPAGFWIFLLGVAVFVHQANRTIRLTYAFSLVHSGPTDQDGIDMAQLEALTHGRRVATPFEIPQRVNRELIRLGQLEPSYSVYARSDWDGRSEQRKITDMRRAPFALVPDDYDIGEYERPDFRDIRIFGFGTIYSKKFPPWIPGTMIFRELNDRWTPAGSVGSYTVYQRNYP